MSDTIKQAQELGIALRKHGVNEIRKALANAFQVQIDSFADQLVALRQKELRKSDVCPLCKSSDMLCKCLTAKMAKTEFVKVNEDKTEAPVPKKEKELSAEGSGGDVEKGKLAKAIPSVMKMPKMPGTGAPTSTMPKPPAASPAAPKPAGIPAQNLSQTPKAPKPPQAAGAASTMHKAESHPTKLCGNHGCSTTVDKSREYCSAHEKKPKVMAKSTDNLRKLAVPSEKDKQIPVPIKKDEGAPSEGVGEMDTGLSKAAPAPGQGRPDLKTALMHDPKSVEPVRGSIPVVTPKLPTMAEHMGRANQFNEFMPKGKFDKTELGACALCKAPEHPGKC